MTPYTVETLTDQRHQAAVAFLFLSGARVRAFVTLPIQAIDLVKRSVKQWPRLGVKTKNRKMATTYLLDIPDLLEVMVQWDQLVRAELPLNAPWYATLTSDGMNFTGSTRVGRGRRTAVAKGIRRLCMRAGIPYHSPHKLRHGHGIYAIKRAKDMAGLRAISQNLMHASLTTTNSIYGVLPEDDVATQIMALTCVKQSTSDAALDALVDVIARRLPDKSDVLVDALVSAMVRRRLEQIEGIP